MQAKTGPTLAEQVAETMEEHTLDDHVLAVDPSGRGHERKQYIDIFGSDDWFEDGIMVLTPGIQQVITQHNAVIVGIETGEIVDSSMRIWFRQIVPPVE